MKLRFTDELEILPVPTVLHELFTQIPELLEVISNAKNN